MSPLPSPSSQEAPEPGCTPEDVFAAPPPEAEIYDEFDNTEDVRQIYDDHSYDPEDPVATARHHHDVGRKAESEERWEDARRELREGWSLRKNVALAFQLAKVSMALGQYRQALYYIDFVLASKNTKDADRAQALEWQKKALALVARLRISTESGACVTVDGLAAGLAPLAHPVMVDAGTSHVKARHAGRHGEAVVSVSAGAETGVTVNLE